VANYARMLAADGYAVATVDYSLAPEHRYPLPVHQLNQSLKFLSDHANRLQLDMSRVVLAGDSAGAQLAAQLALVVTSQAYAREMDISPAMSPWQLRGMVLFCGPFDGRSMTSSPSWFSHTVVWSYFGSPSPPPEHDTFSVVPRVTKDFPPAFISVGNDDPLAPQSVALAEALLRQGVSVDALFYPASHPPALGHEYQFDFSLPESREAFSRTRAFLRTHLAATTP
jgi:acetyl esterase/lipase